MSACESVRGEWGKVCPDCGQMLPPKPGPLRSWTSLRHQEPERVWLIPVADPVEKAKPGRKSEGRDIVALGHVLRHDGNRTAAAAEMGVSISRISHAIRRLAEAGDPDAVRLREGGLTQRQEEALRILAKNGGNRHAAARELGIAAPSLFSMVARLRSRGVEVPA